MSTARSRASAPAAARKTARKRAASSTAPADDGAVVKFGRGIRRWTDAAIGVASSAVDFSVTAAKVAARTPAQRAAVAKAGALIRQAREATGMSLQEVGKAINLSDPALLELAESGKIELPFELLLRLAAVLGRHDPLTFALQLTRNTQPGLWRSLETLGVGKLVVHGGRERELVNIYRGNDDARGLSDADFKRAVAFARQAFEMAVDVMAQRSKPKKR